jgi:acetyltransferase-like isoleucine patch superfamily enzyme
MSGIERGAWAGINGCVKLGREVHIGRLVDINANLCEIVIGDGCDVGSFVAINCADSHKRCIGMEPEIERQPIVLEDHVFVGTHSAILGGVHVGHHSIVAAGTIVRGPLVVPPYSLVIGNPAVVKAGKYAPKGQEHA